VPAGRLAVFLAVAACVAWTLKALAIWNAGGNDLSRLEGPLFAAGLVLAVAACAAAGISLARGAVRRVLAGIAGAAAGLVLVLVVESVVGGAAPDDWGWVQQEVGLWAAAILVLAATLVRLRAARV
jgi:hypothetical protein